MLSVADLDFWTIIEEKTLLISEFLKTDLAFCDCFRNREHYKKDDGDTLGIIFHIFS